MSLSSNILVIDMFYVKLTLLVSFQWDLFRVNELEHFVAMLMRLYKEELEQIVMSYENYRLALLREKERREQTMGKAIPLPQSVEHQQQIQRKISMENHPQAINPQNLQGVPQNVTLAGAQNIGQGQVQSVNQVIPRSSSPGLVQGAEMASVNSGLSQHNSNLPHLAGLFSQQQRLFLHDQQPRLPSQPQVAVSRPLLQHHQLLQQQQQQIQLHHLRQQQIQQHVQQQQQQLLQQQILQHRLQQQQQLQHMHVAQQLPPSSLLHQHQLLNSHLQQQQQHMQQIQHNQQHVQGFQIHQQHQHPQSSRPQSPGLQQIQSQQLQNPQFVQSPQPSQTAQPVTQTQSQIPSSLQPTQQQQQIQTSQFSQQQQPQQKSLTQNIETKV